MPTIGVFASIFDEAERILCVRRNYPPYNWTTPGGRVEAGESLETALIREVFEETGYQVEPKFVIGVYSAPFKDDVVISFGVMVMGRTEWEPNQEIAET